MNWTPPSDTLRFRDGLWEPGAVSGVSYPEAGNDVCFQVEDSSYWFSHRNECILAVVRRFAPGGTFFDIAGGRFVCYRVRIQLERTVHFPVVISTCRHVCSSPKVKQGKSL